MMIDNVRWSMIISLTASLVSVGGFVNAFADEKALADRSVADSRISAQPDFEALKSLPLIDVIERTAVGYTQFLPKLAQSGLLATNEGSRSAFAKIEGLDPELRRLIWLTWLLDCWGPEKTEGLHTFFFLWGGDYASDVRDALFEAGLLRQNEIFREAMATFGPHYPADSETRSLFFAWSQPGTRIDDTTTIPQPLNAFDRKIKALSRAFGDRDQFGRELENFVRNTPRLASWAEEARNKLPEEDRLRWLTERLAVAEPEKMAARIATWPKAYRQLYLLDLFNDEMLNGGVHQFFSNSSGAVAREVAVALVEVGLPKHADAVQRGIAMFASPYPVDRQVRGRYFFVNGETTDWDNKLDALTGDVDDGAIGAAMLAIAKREGPLPK